MPRVPEKFLRCVVYLYKTRKDAEDGGIPVGSGFLISLPSPKYPDNKKLDLLCLVTNQHVSCDSYFVRVNSKDGAEIFPIDPIDWHSHPDGDDVSIMALDADLDEASVPLRTSEVGLSKDDLVQDDINVGDDVFLIGCFVSHDGGKENKPAVRFGHISIMPSPILVKSRIAKSEYYCLDMHTRGGFSGSPVFVFRMPHGNFQKTLMEADFKDADSYFLGLLGVHCGQFLEEWRLTKREVSAVKEGMPTRDLELDENSYVLGLSGMTLVSPFHKVVETIQRSPINALRIAQDEETTRRLQSAPPGAASK